MKKTIEWLNGLPEPYRTMALKNHDPTFMNYEETADSSGSAIGCAFDWEETPPGYEFWADLHSHLFNPDRFPLPPVPNEPEAAQEKRKETELELMKRQLEDAFKESAELLEALEANTETNWDRDFRALASTINVDNTESLDTAKVKLLMFASIADEMEKIRNERRKQ